MAYNNRVIHQKRRELFSPFSAHLGDANTFSYLLSLFIIGTIEGSRCYHQSESTMRSALRCTLKMPGKNPRGILLRRVVILVQK